MIALLLGLASAQAPHDPWRTVETEHYRVHYPVMAEAWALRAASELEAIRERVVVEVGWAPTERVDVLVEDPMSTANGYAIPVRRLPRMGAWITPPEADSVIGTWRSWTEDLLVHEDAHLVHLLRPPRNPLVRALAWDLLGVGPIAWKSPRWLIEGYATVVEGRLTGSGRPNADLRAALLRRWAAAGEMPSYGELSGSGRWMGGSYAYLVGSAYLEWLEARAHPGALRDLWARMSAREERDLDAAFEGVFGDDPATLYARYVAELTHDALVLERAAPERDDTLWLERGGTVGPPDAAGDRLVAVVRAEGKPSRLLVWETADDPEAEAEWRERIDEILAKDPEDVAPVPPRTFPREPVAERKRRDRPAVDPRFLPDGRVLFASWLPDVDGRLRPDLFVWDPDTGRDRRITTRADLRAADPHPTEPWAVAVRQRWGESELVRVDLASGAVQGLVAGGPGAVFDTPAFDPAGRRLAFLRHDGAAWRLVVRDLASGAELLLPVPEGATVTRPAWTPDGTEVVASVGQGGLVELVAFEAGGDGARALTRHGAALAPTVAGAHAFFLGLGARGFDLHRVETSAAAPMPSDVVAGLGPSLALRPPPPDAPPPPEPAELEPPRRYGLGRTEAALLLGGQATPTGSSVELGLRLGDVIGRHEVLLLGAVPFDDAFGGAAAVFAYRGLPIDLRVHGYLATEPAWGDRVGAALIGERLLRFPGGGARLGAGAFGDAPFRDDARPPSASALLSAGVGKRLWAGDAWLSLGASAWGLAGGRLQADAALDLGLGYEDFRLGLGAEIGRSDADYLLGGAPTSLLPPGPGWNRITAPGLAPGFDAGTARDTLRVDLGVQGAGLFGERHRLGGGGTTLAGLRADLDVPRQPIARVPASSVGLGVACVLETPTDGFDTEKPCLTLHDWTGWVGVSWRP